MALVSKSSMMGMAAAHSLDQYWMERHQVSQIKSHRCDQTKPSKYNYNLCLCFLVWRRQLRLYCMPSNLNQIFKRRKKSANLSKLKGAANKTGALNLLLQMNMLIPYHLIIFGLNNPIWFVRFGSIRSMAGAFVFGRAHCFDSSRTIDLWFDFIVSAKFSIFLFCVYHFYYLFICWMLVLLSSTHQNQQQQQHPYAHTHFVDAKQR